MDFKLREEDSSGIYDVALSFAGEQRSYVKEVAKILIEEYGLKVFFDEFKEESLWGKNLYDELYEIYSKRAKYVILFVSKEYKEKIWTDHERKSAQEKSLELEGSYILPVRFDDTQIPGLFSTIGYLDARKKSPQEIAVVFAKKMGLKIKPRWFGKWKKERFSDAFTGTLNIYKVEKDGFYYDILVVHGSYIGELKDKYAEFINNSEAISRIKKDNEDCLIKFTLNKNLYIQENDCFFYHGMRAYFDGKYILEENFFYNFKNINDEILSKLFSLLGQECFESFKQCFSDYWEEKEDNRYILYGKVPGLYPYYNGCLIIENNDIRGFFVNCNMKGNTIFWFATDDELDKEVLEFKKKEQFKDFNLIKIDKGFCETKAWYKI